MYQKTCRCGKTKRNYFIDIGPFFIDECCIEAGYNHLGNKAELNPEDLGLNTEEVQKALNSAESLEIVDDVSDEPENTEVVNDNTEEIKVNLKKKRRYNRNGQIGKIKKEV